MLPSWQPFHFWYNGRDLIIIIAEAVIPAIRVAIEAFSTEVNAALNLGVFPKEGYLPGKFSRILPGECPLKGTIDPVPDVYVSAIAMLTPPIQELLVGDLIVADLEIELWGYIIDPAVAEPEENIGIEIVVVGLSSFTITSFRVLFFIPPDTER